MHYYKKYIYLKYYEKKKYIYIYIYSTVWTLNFFEQHCMYVYISQSVIKLMPLFFLIIK